MDILTSLRNVTIVVIDFEALTPAGRPAEPTEVAAMALVVRDGKLVEDGRFESLIQPPPDVPVTARDTSHGITQTALRAAAPAAAVLGELDRLLSAPPYRLVAQHASTEAGLIARQGEHCPILASTPLLDTVKMARKTLRSLSSYGLDELLRYYGIPKPVQRHRAMPDVEVTAEVFRRLLEEGAAAGHWSTLLELDAAAGLQPRPRPHVPADVPVQDALFRPDVG
ncbi:3'-5' exonuclease [Streptomyces sparsogenes]|uniref:3'-5' exonuclease n=1 Tax=Streptomyces sparsogenes TaxID=67365 RepID=UPI0033DEA331